MRDAGVTAESTATRGRPYQLESVHFMHGAGFGYTGRTSRLDAHLLRIDAAHAIVVGNAQSGAKRGVRRVRDRSDQKAAEGMRGANGPCGLEIAAFRS